MNYDERMALYAKESEYCSAQILAYQQKQRKVKSKTLSFDNLSAFEGYRKEISMQLGSRNSALMNMRKQIDKYKCQACGYKVNINDSYIIECHHTEMICTGEKVTPIDALISLCPNCHRIAHLKKPPYTLAELKKILSKGKPVKQKMPQSNTEQLE